MIRLVIGVFFYQTELRAYLPQAGRSGMTVIRFKVFTILARDGEEERFIERLDALCRGYAPGEAYHFIFLLKIKIPSA